MILDVRDLSVATRDAPAATLLHDINLGVEQGSRVGLVGESGAGKTTLIRAMTGFLPAQRFQCQGSVTVGETDVLRAAPTERRRAVSAAIAVIWQDSITALNPCRWVGTQIRDTLLVRGGRAAAVRRTRRRWNGSPGWGCIRRATSSSATHTSCRAACVSASASR